MVTLYYSPTTKQLTSWQDRLERMAIKHELVMQQDLSQPQLQYGEDHVQGTEAIEVYLDKLEDFVKSWYEDRCDKYEF
ncbi:hypothetical protein Q0590_29885 [Rhodocytophaga aerolata]|uniref:Uncharacterized protein n=1 Tax=Rhodocytophaga aerolata TaxID=455078 RepID=A0ABT8REI9_9BACT|nr:hypothetical protein [Rhodocytophaga aerolata]MDO1450524.1 hypothetical protein [Rhodocytophaga aerolata]